MNDALQLPYTRSEKDNRDKSLRPGLTVGLDSRFKDSNVFSQREFTIKRQKQE